MPASAASAAAGASAIFAVSGVYNRLQFSTPSGSLSRVKGFKLGIVSVLWMLTMRRIHFLLLAALLSALAVPGTASAHRPRVGFGVYFGPGPGFYSPHYYYPPTWYYPPPVYYSQPPVVIQQQPQVYVEQAPAGAAPQAAQQSTGDWFYCPSSKTYYPYVKDCPEPWQRVSSVPPSTPGR